MIIHLIHCRPWGKNARDVYNHPLNLDSLLDTAQITDYIKQCAELSALYWLQSDLQQIERFLLDGVGLVSTVSG